MDRPVTTGLVTGDPEPFPYTKVRDWIPLLPQTVLSDGAFRLYCISRSVIWENVKGGPPPKPVIEITYEEYAILLGRSARTISRHAQDLYAAGLWEVVERAHRSVTVAGKARPEVRTVLTIRVRDHPRNPGAFAGPVKTWDVLSALRENKSQTRPAPREPTAAPERTRGPGDKPERAQSARRAQTRLSTRSGQRKRRATAADECVRTTVSPQSPLASRKDQPHRPSSAQTPGVPGECDRTSVTEPRTDLSTESNVSAGHASCGEALKKIVEEEKPSLPPAPSAVTSHMSDTGQSLADELAMFSVQAITLVTLLYDKTLTAPGLQPLSAAERAGLARRIDARLDEGWSAARIRAVLTGGSLVGVKMPGRLWAGRLDDMPARPAITNPRTGNANGSARDGRASRAVVTNDCSALPDPHPDRTRYQVPDARGNRLVSKWADKRRVQPWCGRCAPDARTLMPRKPGHLPTPCPDCHPEPAAFPPASPGTRPETRAASVRPVRRPTTSSIGESAGESAASASDVAPEPIPVASGQERTDR